MMELSDLVRRVRGKYYAKVKPYISNGDYYAARDEMVLLFESINSAIAATPLTERQPLFEYELRAQVLINYLRKGVKDSIDGLVASFEELLHAPIAQPAQIAQDDQSAKAKEVRTDMGSLRDKFLSMYKEVCGDYGREIFESRVLPAALEFYSRTPRKAMKMVLRIIETAAEYTPNEINLYLASVRLPRSTSGSKYTQPKEVKAPDSDRVLIVDHPSSVRKTKPNQETLEQKFRRLRSLIIIHNNGAY